MNVIIVGCGKVGASLAESLNNEGHKITIIDKDEKILRELASTLDVIGVLGNGVMRDVQREADIQHADILIAATGSDEVNMLCCLIAKNEGQVLTVARIRNWEYEKEIEYLKASLGISFVLNPERMCAHEIVRLLRFPSALEIETFYRGKIDMITVELSEKSKLCQVALKDLTKTTAGNALICVIERQGKAMIPSGDTVLQAGDHISYIATPQEASKFMKECVPEQKSNKSVFFVGGGKIANYVAHYMRTRKSKAQLKFIEQNASTAKTLAERYPEYTVINADGAKKQTLLEEGIQNADCLVSITGIDEQNIFLSLTCDYVEGLRKITKVNHIDVEDIPRNLQLGSLVCPKMITSNAIVRYARALESSQGSSIESLYKIAGGRVEAQEYEVSDVPKLTDTPLKDLKLKGNTLIAAIIRNNELIKPGGNDVILKNDHVVIIAYTDLKIRELGDILQ